jgi:hypothetical protein
MAVMINAVIAPDSHTPEVLAEKQLQPPLADDLAHYIGAADD